MSKRRPKSNGAENAMVRALDQLAEFDTFQAEIAPILRQAIKEGWTAERIESDPKVQALLVARQLSIALMGRDKNTGAALSAIQDSRNRTTGKPIEKRDIKMTLENLSDEALDAKLAQLDADDAESATEH